MVLSWMVKYAAKAELSAQKEYVCIREAFQWERDMWMLPSALYLSLAGKAETRENEMEVLACPFLPFHSW